MKILHLSSERSWRGGEQQLAYLVEETKARGIEVFVACKRASAFLDYCKKNAVPYIELGFKNEFDLLTAASVSKFCKQNAITFLHAHSSHSHAMAVWAKVLGCPAQFILHRRVDFPIKPNVLSRFKFNHKSLKKIICISKAIEVIMRKDLHNPEVCCTVQSGINLDKFKHSKRSFELHKKYNIDLDTKLIGNISAVADHKDYYTFVDTAKEIIASSKDKIHFFIIGDGPLKSDIEQYIAQQEMSSYITMTGFVANIPSIIQDLDIFLMTSKTEGLGTTILDAFANRLPVVATKAGGIPEAVIHLETGLLYEVKDHKNLAIGVLKLLKDEKLAERLTSNAHKHLLTHFTKEKMAQGVIEVYHSLI